MKTTKVDFQLFQEECKKWIDKFGLYDWGIAFIHTKDSENLAWVLADVENHMATIYLNEIWLDEKVLHKEETIRQIAFHEVCEVLISELDDLGRKRFDVTESTLLNARHRLIHRLEKGLYKDYKEV